MATVAEVPGDRLPHPRWLSSANDRDYRRWRDARLARYPLRVEELLVEIRDPFRVTPAEHAAIMSRCDRANMALYAFGLMKQDELLLRAGLLSLGATFGLRAIEDHRSAGTDGIVRIEVVNEGGRNGYIPYTDRPISWHTDGYYNFHSPRRCVGAMLLHCARSAEQGGENRLLDPEIAYIKLRDDDPAHIGALMHPAAMSIPENAEESGAIRPVNVGPVFFVHPSGALGMRYTARKRNILWRDDEQTRKAVAALERILDTDPLVLRIKMSPGQGMICNNVLHDRSGFRSAADEGRLLYRVRYHGRICRPEN
ncbi:MAG: TauD/TfdA family dioxygenase [Bradyrhizobium sp.]|nr:TauD/TfdA family dioxygenase [Bradyrhizobium sp.]